MRKAILTYCILFLSVLSASNYLGLESKVPDNWSSTAPLSISGSHYKLGNQSVKWNWENNSIITISEPEGLASAANTYRGGMMLWIYNENASNQDITFRYKDTNGAIQYYFKYHIDFVGWRACWIRFDEDMSGDKNNRNLSTLEILAPSGNGTLYFDRMSFPSSSISNSVTPDQQLPSINPEMNLNHWGALWHWEDTYHYELVLPVSISENEKAELDKIRSSISTSISGESISTARIEELKEIYSALNIHWNNGYIQGVAIVSDKEYESSNNDYLLKDIDQIICDIAYGWIHNGETGFDEMFVNIIKWSKDQGLAYGSAMGTNELYGYYFRALPQALFLMKDVLIEAGIFEETKVMLHYWTGIAEVRQYPQLDNFQGIADAWNTIIEGRLIAILLDENTVETQRNVASFTRWLEGTLEYSVGTMGGLKPDGAGFHHGMLYPNYMNGGYGGIGKILNYLYSTTFQLDTPTLDRLKQAFLLHAYYSNERSFPTSISGRLPLDQEIGTDAINALGYLAKAYSPVDTALAQEFLRVNKYSTDLYSEITAMGFEPTQNLDGNLSVNYGALNIHRRDHWMVTSKGFNKVVTGTEIYSANNRYGRYQSYGTVQILGNSGTVSAASSGWLLSGWDWNRYPGSTTIHLPFEDLRWNDDYPNVNERSQKEEFSGALSYNNNGLFALSLDENNNVDYTDDFVAHKSVFAFDDMLVCLGSNISNSNTSQNTETTLFQTHLSGESEPIHFRNTSITAFPYSTHENLSSATTLMDNVGNGYYLSSGELNITRKNQESRDNSTSATNDGDFASAWINHGAAPNNASYEYAILPQTSNNNLDQFMTDMSNEATAHYTVLRQTSDAHIVSHSATATTAYALFDTHDALSSPDILSNSNPCLIMVESLSDRVKHVTLADPVLNMETPTTLTSSDLVNSRTTLVTLYGNYQLESEYKDCFVVEKSNQTTTLQFDCIHGLAIDVMLKNSDNSGASINDPQKDAFTIFPNPATDMIHVKTEAYITRVGIYATTGLLMKSDSQGASIDVSDLPRGMYIVKVSTKDQQVFISKVTLL